LDLGAFSDWFLLVSFVVYAFIMKEQALKVSFTDRGCHFKWYLRPTNTDWSCFQQGKARWNQMYIEQLKMSNVIDIPWVIWAESKTPNDTRKFLWVLKQIFDMLSNLLRSFVLLGSSLFMIRLNKI
jgi:hypothetical protein